jgi:hypothetical protein
MPHVAFFNFPFDTSNYAGADLTSQMFEPLMRHASSRFTLEVYTQEKAKAKREAQQRIVEMMLPEEDWLISNCNVVIRRKSLAVARNCEHR